jgi:hypothetical protein
MGWEGSKNSQQQGTGGQLTFGKRAGCTQAKHTGRVDPPLRVVSDILHRRRCDTLSRSCAEAHNLKPA